MDIIVTALSVVFSGVVATVITILYQKFSGEQTAKRKVFETAVSYRFFISEEEDDEILKKLQIKTAEKTASDAVGQQNTPQNEQFANQMMLQLLPKLIENPDSFSKLIELADKAKK